MASATDLLTALDAPDAATRVRAAQELEAMSALPPEAIEPLIRHLDDAATVHEDWTDWNGSVVGGTDHVVAEHAQRALWRLGTGAFVALLARVEAGERTPAMLAGVLAGLGIDDLRAAGRDAIARAMRIVPTDSDVRALLAWALDEEARADERISVLGRRLVSALPRVGQRAAAELGTVVAADAPRAATLLAELVLDQAPAYALQGEAIRSLRKLGPVLADALAARLVDVTPDKALFHHWPDLLPTVARYPVAARLGPWLLGWVRGDTPDCGIGPEHLRDVRAAAAAALATLGDGVRELQDELAELYAAGPTERRKRVLAAVTDRSALVTALAPRWKAILAGTKPKPIDDVLDAIYELEAAGAPLVDAILPFVEGSQARLHATLAVGHFGEAARPAVPALIRALWDPKTRNWACLALQGLPPDVAAEAIEPLEALVASERADGRPVADAERALRKLRGER